jgi:hypothetical protein
VALPDYLKDLWCKVLQAREWAKTYPSREIGMRAIGRANLAYIQAVMETHGGTAKIDWETGEVSVRT